MCSWCRWRERVARVGAGPIMREGEGEGDPDLQYRTGEVKFTN